MRRWLPVLAFFFCVQVALAQPDPEGEVLSGDFWKQQGLEEVLPAWTEHAADEEYGAFHAFLDRDWTPGERTDKYPGMIARHVFSYAAAYLLSGDDEHLEQAEALVDYLIENGWDEEHGGWYEALTREGAVSDSSKGLFMQIYAATGLSLYYAVTREKRAKDYLDRTLRLLDEHAWDAERGGYVRSLQRDLSVKNSYKDFSPQLAPLSGYLMYLYPATRDTAYLRRAEEIMEVVLENMRTEDGWILERFDRDWRFLPDDPKNSHLNVGHNAEVAWLLLRLYLLTGEEDYREEALALNEKLLDYAFDAETGVWHHRLKVDNPSAHEDTTPWWVQAYGNMLQLYLYRVTGEERYLQHFASGARFWNDHFVDEEHGGTVLSVHLDGRLDRGAKAVRTKTSYHAMEHALLNYLYLRLWVEEAPATLHFRIEEPTAGEQLYPVFIEDTKVAIQDVQVNDEAWEDFAAQAIRLSEQGPVRVEVVLDQEAH